MLFEFLISKIQESYLIQYMKYNKKKIKLLVNLLLKNNKLLIF